MRAIRSARRVFGAAAAVGLVRLKVAPVLSITLPFGGDNHADDGLQNEATQHVESIGALAQLMTLLEQNGLSDSVTFATLNVFGRTLLRKGTAGRDHWPRHAVSLLIGKRVRAGVVGGVVVGAERPQSLNFCRQQEQTRFRLQPCAWLVPGGHSRTVHGRHPGDISERPDGRWSV